MKHEGMLLMIRIVVAGLGLSMARGVNAQVLFFDDFTTSVSASNVNFEYTVSRQSGSLADIQYRQGNGVVDTAFAPVIGTFADETTNGGWTAINSGILELSGDGTFAVGCVSPEQNFDVNPGAGNDLSISFTVDPVVGAGGSSPSWAAITLGAGDNAAFGVSGSGARGQSILYSAPHFGILLRDNGEYQAFNASAGIGSGSYTPTPGASYSVNFRISGLIDGNPWDGVNDALIEIYVDGEASPFFSYTKTDGFADNYITLMGESDGGYGASQFDDFTVAVVPTLLPFEITVAPTDSTTNATRTLQAIVVERASTFGSATLFLDETAVSTNSTRTGVTNTVSYVASGLAVGVHTGKVVVVGTSPSVTLTNEWSFSVAPVLVNSEGIVSWNYNHNGDAYSTQSDDASGVTNVVYWNDSSLDGRSSDLLDNGGTATSIDIALHSPGWGGWSVTGGHPGLDADGSHNREIINGYLNGTTGAGGSGVTVSQIPYSLYDVYVYFSSDVTNRTGTVTDGSTTYYFNTLGAPSINDAAGNALFLQATDTTTNGYAVAANYAVFSDLSGDAKTVMVNVGSGGGLAAIQIVGKVPPGPAVDPVFQSINVAGGNVTLSWTAENKGTYSIWRKTDLTSGSWNRVATNLPSGNLTTNVTASGASQEFYQVRGE